MAIRHGIARTISLAVSGAAVAIACAASAAEPATEVIVEAPKVTHTGTHSEPLRAPVDLASIRYRVSYGDLDLATPAGARALEERIHEAARRACRQLEASLPPDAVAPAGDPPCIQTATGHAMKLARAAIAAAGQKAAP